MAFSLPWNLFPIPSALTFFFYEGLLALNLIAQAQAGPQYHCFFSSVRGFMGTETGTWPCFGEGLSGGTYPASPSQKQVTGAPGTPDRKGP